MYNSGGEKTWAVEYDIYGKVRKLVTGSLNDCPFRYQGQFEDVETGLYYNRNRYYSAESGTYISQDPIKIIGGSALYAYTRDSNSWIDPLGLTPTPTSAGDVGAFKDLKGVVGDDLTPHHMPQDALGHMPRADGGCLVMPHDEHVQTRTYGSKGRATKKLDAGRPFKDVLKDDIIDVRKIGGDKYDDSLKKLIGFYEDNGKLKKGELTLASCK